MPQFSDELLNAIDARINQLAPDFQTRLRQSTTIKDTGSLKKDIRVKVSRPAPSRWVIGLHMKRYGYILHNQAVSGKYKSSRSVKLPPDSKLARNPKKYQQIVELFFELEDQLIAELNQITGESLENQIVSNWRNVFAKNISV